MTRGVPPKLDYAVIAAALEAGHRQADVARRYGVSRERIRQLNQKLGDPCNTWVGPIRAADWLRIGHSTVYQWWRHGYLPLGPGRMARRDTVLAFVTFLRERQCHFRDCTRLIGTLDITMKFCAPHRRARRRYNYPFLSAASRAKHSLAIARWRARYPEKVKEINARARQAYARKKKNQA